MRGSCDGEAVKGLEALARVETKKVSETRILKTDVEISDTKGVVVAAGNDTPATQADADGVFRWVGVFVGKCDTRKKTDPLVVRLTIDDGLDGLIPADLSWTPLFARLSKTGVLISPP